MRSSKTQPNSLQTDWKAVIFRKIIQNMFLVLWRWKQRILQHKTKPLCCCDIRLKASNAVNSKPKYDEIKRSSQLRTLLKKVVVNMTWKKFRPVRNLNTWPLRYRCSALPTELTSQLGAGWRMANENHPSDEWWFYTFIYLQCRGEMKLRDPPRNQNMFLVN